MSPSDSNHSILCSADDLRKSIIECASLIDKDYFGKDIDIVCLTNSGTAFCFALLQHLTVTSRLHYLSFQSFDNASPKGVVRITSDILEPLTDRHILIIEGMVISGKTPRYLVDLLGLHSPASISLAAVGVKPHLISVELPLKYHLYEFKDQWVAGFGIGDSSLRPLPYLVDLH